MLGTFQSGRVFAYGLRNAAQTDLSKHKATLPHFGWIPSNDTKPALVRSLR